MFEKLFKKSANKSAFREQTVDKIELVLNSIEKITIKYIGEKKGNFKEIKESEIQSLENKCGLILPEAYKLFLKKFAGNELKIFDNQSYNIHGIFYAQEVSEELILQDNFTLPENSFVFSQWQGYQFYYFENSGSENPETFLYIEGGDDAITEPPEIYACGNFTDWLIDLTINSMKVISENHGYKVDKGIEELEKLKINGT